MELELISLLFPSNLLEYFTVTQVQEKENTEGKTKYIEIQLEEKNIILGDKDTSQYESKGFMEITIQDFPLRGRAVFLKIKRRRWRHKINPKDIIKNDFTFLAEGSKFTKELSDFLKGTGRYEGRHDNERW